MLSIFFLSSTNNIYIFHNYIFKVKMNSISQNEFYDLRDFEYKNS